MKKILFRSLFCTLCLILTGCGSRTAKTSSQAFGTAAAPSAEASTVLTSAAETPAPTVSPGTNAPDGSSAEENSAESVSIFDTLPQSFYFSSGVGAWATELQVAPDGSFTGGYQDTDMGDMGTDYPNGTIYICRFSGRFSAPQPIDDHSYSMTLESLELDGTVGEVSYKDGVRYIYSEPYGMDDAKDFLIYLPGTPLSQIAEAFLSWVSIDTTAWDALPPGYYGIYNVNAEKGFVGVIPQNP